MIAYVREENRILKNKLKGKRIRFTDDERRRLTVKGKVLGRTLLREFASIVTPDTSLPWHRRRIAQKWDYSKRRGPGRPPAKEEIAKLTVRMARENPSWGYTTIMGVLFNLGHVVARETVCNILKEHGIEPAPERPKCMPWSTFLKAHWESIAAADLFTVEVWTMNGLVRYYVLFFIKLPSRRIHVAGITANPRANWIKQIAWNVTDPIDGFLLGTRYLIMDRMIFFGEGSLRKAINEFVEFYDHERNHQGLGNLLLDPTEEIGATDGPVACRARLGRFLRYYDRQAA